MAYYGLGRPCMAHLPLDLPQEVWVGTTSRCATQDNVRLLSLLACASMVHLHGAAASHKLVGDRIGQKVTHLFMGVDLQSLYHTSSLLPHWFSMVFWCLGEVQGVAFHYKTLNS